MMFTFSKNYKIPVMCNKQPEMVGGLIGSNQVKTRRTEEDGGEAQHMLDQH